VPSNVKSAYVSIAGGGSGAYEGFPRLISGASGGNLSSYPVNLTAGESISITVGLGGLANGTGGATQFGNYVTCTGGLPSNGGTLAYAGNCGAAGGVGNNGQFFGVGDSNTNTAGYGGHLSGGVTSIGFGAGGYANMSWSAPNSGIFGYSSSGFNGVVFVDVLY
jgi:hypothetical protein